jgi:hypothetical protein
MQEHRTRLALVVIAATIATAVAGCGGSSKKSTSTTTTTTTTATATTTSASTTKKASGPPHKPVLTETVVVAKSGVPAAKSATVKAGDAAVFRTFAPAKHKAKPVKVTIAVTQAGPKWMVTASTKGQKPATATITSATGKPLPIELLYSCELPPTPTFCPPDHVSNGKHVSAVFTTTHAAPLTLTAVVAPPTSTTKTTTPGTLVVSPYHVIEQVASRTPTTGATPAPVSFGTTATVKPGDELLLKSKLTGAANGATQPLTLTINQGPGKSLTVTGGVPGGKTSTVTVNSANGKPIAIVTPRFSCYLPPTPTFCPASKISAGSHKYVVTFPATPGTAAVRLSALVQAA